MSRKLSATQASIVLSGFAVGRCEMCNNTWLDDGRWHECCPLQRFPLYTITAPERVIRALHKAGLL